MVVDSYREYLLGRGLTTQTVRDYERELRGIVTWLEHRDLGLHDVVPSQLGDYARTRPNTYGCRAQLRRALAHWWEWQGITGWPDAIPVPTPKPMISQALDPEDSASLKETARGWWRPGTAVLVGLYLGLRNAEIAGMQWESFDDEGWVTIVGKGLKTRTVAVPPIIAEELDGRRNGTPWVFEGYKGSHVSGSTILKWTHQVADAADIEVNVWTHRLRHTAIRTALDRTKNLRAVQYWAGHSKPETTAGYAGTTREWLEDIRDALDY